MFLLSPYGTANEEQATEAKAKSHQTTQFRTVEWVDLMPKADLDALSNPPSYITALEDGSTDDQISDMLQSEIDEPEDRYQQALVSTDIVPEMNGQAIRIPGFIVPLEFNDDDDVTQFFLVPFFGACLHVPPPPPNQIILVNSPAGLKLDSMYDPFWISGVLETKLVGKDLGTSAYSMEMQEYDLY